MKSKKTWLQDVGVGERNAYIPSHARPGFPYRLPLIPFTALTLTALVLAACGPRGAEGGESTDPIPQVGATNQVPTVGAVVSTLIPGPSPTPQPSLVRLTEPGCCTGPDWSADGTAVRFIDKPPTLSVGFYGVRLEGGAPSLVQERLGQFSPDDRYLAYPEGGETYVEEIATGQRWVIDNGGRRVFFSPGSTRLVWTQARGGGGFDLRPVDYHVLAVSGEPVSEPITLYGGGFSGWLDDDHLLVAGKPASDDERALYKVNVLDGSLVELARGERVRSGIPSPGGSWVAYLVLFDEEQPERNGFWVVSADAQIHYQLDLFGPVQWRDADRFLVVPQDLGAGSHRIVEVDARTGAVRALTDSNVTPFRVEGGDWRVSPDGRHVVFVSAEDRALWLLRLPD